MGCGAISKDSDEGERPSITKPTQRARTERKIKINARLQGEPDKMFENVHILKGEGLSHINELKIMEILKNHFFFYGMLSSERSQIISKMVACKIEKNQYVFKQGDPASAFFIIDDGKVDVQINGKRMKSLTEGDYFGQLALIYMAPRSASIKAVIDTHFWCITRGVFRQTVEEFVKKNYKTAKSYLSSISLLTFLTEQQKDSIAYNMLNLKYQDRQVIFKQNDDANSFFIITEGCVEIGSKINGPVSVLKKVGEAFGQQAFQDNQVRLDNAIAKGKTMCLSIGRDVVKNILGDKMSNIINYNIMKNAIEASQMLSKLGKVQIEKLLQTCRLKNYQDGQVIYKKGEEPCFLAISIQGCIGDNKNKEVVGEQYLRQQIKKIPKDVTKSGKGLVGIITYDDISRVINKKVTQINSFKRASYQKKMQVVVKNPSDNSYIRLDDLIYVKKLGEGQFGKVYLVRQSKDSQNYYAIKCIKKNQVIENKMEKIILEQKRILEMISFPMMLSFVKSFKDSQHIYFLLQYIKGSELFDVIRQIGVLKKTIGRFYISSLILSVQYLHMKNVIYRDLKPENVMVETDGYLKLIDMGTAKELKQSKGFRTFTIIGTPHYMAPEVMQGKGYTFAVDIWSLGVLLYEFICGSLPFAEDLEDPYQIHSQIMKGTLKYPSFFEDGKAMKLIQQFLNRIPELRLPKGFAALKASTYFEGFCWDDLYSRKMKSPYIPKSRKNENPTDQGSQLLNVIYQDKRRSAEGSIQSPIPRWDEQF